MTTEELVEKLKMIQKIKCEQDYKEVGVYDCQDIQKKITEEFKTIVLLRVVTLVFTSGTMCVYLESYLHDEE